MLLGLLRAPYAAQRNYTAQIVEQAITEYLIKEHSRLDTCVFTVSYMHAMYRFTIPGLI